MENVTDSFSHKFHPSATSLCFTPDYTNTVNCVFRVSWFFKLCHIHKSYSKSPWSLAVLLRHYLLIFKWAHINSLNWDYWFENKICSKHVNFQVTKERATLNIQQWSAWKAFGVNSRFPVAPDRGTWPVRHLFTSATHTQAHQMISDSTVDVWWFRLQITAAWIDKVRRESDWWLAIEKFTIYTK